MSEEIMVAEQQHNGNADADRIAALEEAIRAHTAELKALKAQRHLCYDDYANFERDKYGSLSLSSVLNAPLRDLAVRLATLIENQRPHDGSKYLSSSKKTKVKDLSKEQISFANNFLAELYPVVEKYAKKSLREKLGG